MPARARGLGERALDLASAERPAWRASGGRLQKVGRGNAADRVPGQPAGQCQVSLTELD